MVKSARPWPDPKPRASTVEADKLKVMMETHGVPYRSADEEELLKKEREQPHIVWTGKSPEEEGGRTYRVVMKKVQVTTTTPIPVSKRVTKEIDIIQWEVLEKDAMGKERWDSIGGNSWDNELKFDQAVATLVRSLWDKQRYG